MTTNLNKIICVTGASGYIAGHVIRNLLEAGFNVRGTVRDPPNSSNDFLRKLAETDAVKTSGGKLTLFKANLLEEGSFDDAVKGVDVVIHMAAVVGNNGEPWEIIRQGVDGAVTVGKAATKAKIPRMVYTSSLAAIMQNEENRHPDRRGKLFDETEFRLDCRPYYAPYETEKLYSEIQIKENYFGELIVICPGLVLGPLLENKVRSSMEAIRLIANREYGGIVPSMVVPMVDVRDVAAAHVVACFSKMPEGVRNRRYICALPPSLGLVDVSAIVGKHFPHLAPPTLQLPRMMLGIMPKIDSRFSQAMAEEWPLPKPGVNNSRIQKELEGFKFQYTDMNVIVKDAVESLMEHGITKKPEGKK